MSLDKILVIIVGMCVAGFTYWFFLMRKQNTVSASGSIDIVVDGGYTPEVISIPVGKTITLNFIRKDPSTCLEEVVLGDFKVRKYLPLNQKVSIAITPKTKGEYVFTCGMNMFHGKLIVI